MATLYHISDGPGIFDLMGSLFYDMPRRQVNFKIRSTNGDTVMWCENNSLERVCGDTWDFKGWQIHPDTIDWPNTRKLTGVTGRFSTRTRQGNIIEVS